jgi:RimJ/RimL family protein N-acetyltransferase
MRAFRRFLSRTGQWSGKLLRYRAGHVYRFDASMKTSEGGTLITAPGELRVLMEAEVEQTVEWAAPRETVARRRSAGDVCYGICLEREVVYLHWLSASTCYIRGADLLLTLRRDDRYCYGVQTKPSARGRGIYQAAQQGLMATAAAEGIHTIVAYVEAHNPIPRYVYRKLGYRVSKRLVGFRVLGFRLGNWYDVRTGLIRRQLMNGAERRYYCI